MHLHNICSSYSIKTPHTIYYIINILSLQVGILKNTLTHKVYNLYLYSIVHPATVRQTGSPEWLVV